MFEGVCGHIRYLCVALSTVHVFSVSMLSMCVCVCVFLGRCMKSMCLCTCVQVRWGSQGQEMLQGSADGCRKPINLVCVFPDLSFS